MAEAALARHDLLRLRAIAADPLPASVPADVRAAWTRAGRPVIVRRRCAADGAGVSVGLPLPPAAGKGRIAMSVPRADLAPGTLLDPEACFTAAPDPWRPTLAAAARLARDHDVTVRCYGALLWQSVMALPYLHERSDIDLLWLCPAGVPPRLPDGLAALADAAPMPVDGEFVVAGEGVQWRELHAARDGDTVLAKSMDGAVLRPAGTFLRDRES